MYSPGAPDFMGPGGPQDETLNLPNVPLPLGGDADSGILSGLRGRLTDWRDAATNQVNNWRGAVGNGFRGLLGRSGSGDMSEDVRRSWPETYKGIGSADAAYSWLQNFKDAPDFKVPGENLRETSDFGTRVMKDPTTGEISTKRHLGKDYGPTKQGDTTQSILASADGEVARTGYQKGGAGSYVVLKHKNGYETKYFHAAESSKLSPGTSVTAGQKIGTIGNTGNSTATHLHFEIRRDGKALNPDIFLNPERIMFGK